ncbi:hypothetical protein GGP60_003135 [Salinibacter ruber]|nr:hypothetical protein [Salinibacter ruber]
MSRDLQREKATSKTFAFDKFENLTDEDVERAIRNVAPTDYRGAVDALYSVATQKDGKSRWGEKMPRYVLQVSWLASTFPDSQIVHIVRDPRDVAASICRAGWKRTLRDAAEYWKERVTEGRRQGRLVDGDRYYEVKYEMLLRNPTETLQELAGHLDIQFRSGMVENDNSADDTLPEAHREAYGELFSSLDRPIDPSRAGAWEREMPQRDIADVESVTAPIMEEFGYEVSGASVPLRTKGARWLKGKVIPFGRWIKQRITPQ